VRADAKEGDIGSPLREIASAHSDTSIGSYPYIDDNGKPNTNVVVRARDQGKLDAAMADVKAMLAALHGARNPVQ
jgi:molybdopterin-biosynthesis enzyme MoeA-like protein